MNASAVILFFVIAVFVVVSGFPAVEELNHKGIFIPVQEDPKVSEEISLFENSAEEIGLRFPRATCDLLSINLPIGSLNHAACAAHCLAMRKGFRGGRCKNGVCHCRK